MLADDGDRGYRLWQIVAAEPSLRDGLGQALETDPAGIAAALVQLTVRVLDVADAWAAVPVRLPLGLRSVGLAREPLRFVGQMPYPASVVEGEAAPTDAVVLRRLGVELAFAMPVILPVREAVERALDATAAGSAGRRAQTARRFLRTMLKNA